MEITAVYAFAGALAPGEDLSGALRDMLRTVRGIRWAAA